MWKDWCFSSFIPCVKKVLCLLTFSSIFFQLFRHILKHQILAYVFCVHSECFKSSLALFANLEAKLVCTRNDTKNQIMRVFELNFSLDSKNVKIVVFTTSSCRVFQDHRRFSVSVFRSASRPLKRVTGRIFLINSSLLRKQGKSSQLYITTVL